MKIFIIAEAGSVHDGSFGNAKNLCKLAKKCGADAIKFQLHFSEEETLKKAPSPKHFKSESRFKYFERTSFTFDQWKKLKNYCKKIEIDFFLSIFSEKALEFVKKMKLKYVKIPSGEVTNLPLLKEISKTKLKVILSTGMSNFAEIDEAIKILGKKTILMQCTSEYPTQNKRVGLNVVTDFSRRYKGIQTGFSDHTNSIASAIGAVMLGTKYIEKHITFSNEMYGSDAKFATEPNEFTNYCKEIRNICEIINNPVNKNNVSMFRELKKVYEKILVSNKEIKKGSVINSKNIAVKKAGEGISAKFFYQILNKKIRKNLKKNEIIKWHHLR